MLFLHLLRLSLASLVDILIRFEAVIGLWRYIGRVVPEDEAILVSLALVLGGATLLLRLLDGIGDLSEVVFLNEDLFSRVCHDGFVVELAFL